MTREDHGEGTAGPRPEMATTPPRPRCARCGRRTQWSKMLRAYICPLWDHIDERTTDA